MTYMAREPYANFWPKVADTAFVAESADLIGDVTIGEHASVWYHTTLVGAGALITKGTVIPPNSLVLGSPAKVVKDLGPESADNNHKWAEKYVKVAARYTERVINPGF